MSSRTSEAASAGELGQRGSAHRHCLDVTQKLEGTLNGLGTGGLLQFEFLATRRCALMAARDTPFDLGGR